MLSNNYEKELENCTFVKTICMLSVVFYHSILFWNGNWFVGNPVISCSIWKVISQWLNSFHVYCFTFISGYLFYFNCFEKEKYQSFKSFFIIKLKRLIIPFFFISIFWVIPLSLFFYKWTILEVVQKFIFMTSPSQLWFLIMLFGVNILGYILRNIFNNNTFLSLCLTFGMYFFAVLASSFIENYFCIISILKFLIFFYIGFYYRKNKTSLLRKIPSFAYLIVDLILFSFIYFFLLQKEMLIIKLFTKFLSFFLQVIGTLMFFSSMQKMGNYFNKWKKSKIFILLSKNSMTIYLLHQQIIYFTILLLNGSVNPYVNGFINFIFSIVVSLVVSYFLHKSKILRFLIGEK